METNNRDQCGTVAPAPIPTAEFIAAKLSPYMRKGMEAEVIQLAEYVSYYIRFYHKDLKRRHNSRGTDPSRDAQRLESVVGAAQKIEGLIAALGEPRREQLLIAYDDLFTPVGDGIFDFDTEDQFLERDLESLARLKAACERARKQPLSRGRRAHSAEVLLLYRIGCRVSELNLMKSFGKSRTSQFYKFAQQVLALAGYHATRIDALVTDSVARISKDRHSSTTL